MKILLKTFIISILLASYTISSYAYVSLGSYGISIGYAVNKLIASSNKPESIIVMKI